MRAIVQRVKRAAVSVDSQSISSIERGICVLIGISNDDKEDDIAYIARKILNLRIFDDDSAKRWSSSVKDKKLEILCVSQFTLYATLKGNKPDFHNSMNPERSKPFYESFLQTLRDTYQADLVKDGKFGEFMTVSIENDGPVTIMLDSVKDSKSSVNRDSKVKGDDV